MHAPLVVYVTPEHPAGRVAFSVKETAQLLGVSEYSVRRAVKDGQLHEVVMNEKRTLIPAWSIDDFLGARPKLELGAVSA
jgi:predicted site-specific integrase-resolvase